jgi:hypothetical protein
VGSVASGDTYHLPPTTYYLRIYLSTYLLIYYMWFLWQVATPTTYHLPPTYLRIYYLLDVGPGASGNTYHLPPTT